MQVLLKRRAGQYSDIYHDIFNLSKMEGRSRIYTIVGYICETDTFASNRLISEVRKGDILCFKNAGAYCFSMASNYNSRYRPAEVLWHEGKAVLVRKSENFDDLIRNQIDVSDLFKAEVTPPVVK